MWDTGREQKRHDTLAKKKKLNSGKKFDANFAWKIESGWLLCHVAKENTSYLVPETCRDATFRDWSVTLNCYVIILPAWKMKSFYWRLWWSSVFFISIHSIPPDNSSLGGRWSASHVSNVPLHVMCNYIFFSRPERLPTINSHCAAFKKKKISLVTDTDFLIRKKGWRRTKHEIKIVHYQLLWTIVTCEFWTGCSDIKIDLLTGESRFLIPVNSFANLLPLQLTS